MGAKLVSSRRLAFISAVSIALPSPALACFPGNETVMWFPSTPPLTDKEVALEIEIMGDPSVNGTPARVIKVLSGDVSVDHISLSRDSCDKTRTSIGDRGIVVGEFVFRNNQLWFFQRGRPWQPEPAESIPNKP
jgi:hypothetical protein